MKIDLQIHTTGSDGRNSPREIATLASKGGLGVIAITDHDTVTAVEDVQRECKKFGIRVIPGVEISTTFKGKAIHVLGYNIDVRNRGFSDFLGRINEYRRQSLSNQLPILNANLRRAGKKEVNPDHYRDREPNYYCLPGLGLFMVEEGVIDEQKQAFDYFGGIKNTVPRNGPAEAFDAIHRAGGIAVLSHPVAPKISLMQITPHRSEQEKLIADLAKQGLDGLECYGTGQTGEGTEFCLNICDKLNLKITGGSDWHGPVEQVGENIRQYLPFYLKKLGDLAIPEESVQRILKGLGGV